MENKYHIDVTPEEDQLFRFTETSKVENKKVNNTPSNSLFKNKMFWVVLVVHVVILSLIGYAAAPNKQPLSGVEEDKNFVTKEPGTISSPSPTPSEVKQDPLMSDKNIPMDCKPKEIKPQTIKPPIINKNNNSLTKEYTVKNGDTIYSISKKYKLNVDKLLKINDIKDPNKITMGQKLKFM